ncbi:MAG: cell division protein FtsL, partial [Deltaproteobacteria bacterium]|nr:cell division protein FtsL [Deltaproteobacteria bacterium]
ATPASRPVFQDPYFQQSIRRGSEWGLSSHQKKRLAKELILLMTTLMICSLFYVWSRIKVIEKGYRLGELRQQQMELQETDNNLSLEAATLRSSQRLEQIGRNQFGLALPKEDQVIFLGAPPQ